MTFFVLICRKFWFVFLLLPLSLYAEEADEDFLESPVGEIGNEDSDIEITSGIKSVNYAGSGCPRNSAQVLVSNDRKTLSVLFSNFDLEILAGTVANLNKDCRVQVDFKVPSKIRATVVRVDYRGFNKLPLGAKSVLRQSYSVLDLASRLASPLIYRRRQFLGPLEQEFAVASRIRRLQHWSTCGQDFRLDVGINLKLNNQLRKESALSVLDSADGTLGHRKAQYHLRWKRCGGSTPKPYGSIKWLKL